MNVSPNDHAPRDGASFWTPITLALLYLGTLFYAYVLYAPCDDTYIYLVYIKNQLAGNGLTFNGDKVQGFTSTLWTALIWVVAKLGVDPPRAANVLSGASASLALIATYCLGRRIGMSSGKAMLAPLCLATTGDFAFYASNGLETVLFTALLTFSIGFLWVDKSPSLVRSLAIPLLFAATILARPEGIMMCAIILGFIWWRTRDWKFVMRTAIIAAAFLAPIQFLLKSYYGHWLPNSYHAKTGAGLANLGQGLQYFVNFANWAVLFVLGLVFVLVFRFRLLGPVRWALLTLLVVWIGRVIIQGGDNMVGSRVLLPIVPLLYVMVVKGLELAPKRAVVVGVVFITVYHVVIYNFGNIYGSSWNVHAIVQAEQWRLKHEERKEVAFALKDRAEQGDVIAVNAAGVIPYYSELKTIDMLGLNNEYLAHHGKRDWSMAYGHQVADGEWVLAQKPDVILLGGVGSRKADRFSGDHTINNSPEFVRNYNMVQLPAGAVGYFRAKKAGRRRSTEQR